MAIFQQRRKIRYKFIQEHSSVFSVRKMCQILNASKSAYYDWLKRPKSNHKKQDEKLIKQIERVHKESYETYGNLTIKAQLNKEGINITYISTDEGWLYLVGVEDLFQRNVVGWSFGNRITKELTIAALEQAVARQCPPKGLIFHNLR